MAKRKRMPTDLHQRAKATVDFATSDEPNDENDEARAGGRKGGASNPRGSGRAERQAKGHAAARDVLDGTVRFDG